MRERSIRDSGGTLEDIKKPETLVKINALISRIFRAFGGKNAENEVLSMSFIINSIKMTPDTSINFKHWLSSTMNKKNLRVLQQWLEWVYSESVEEALSQKSSHGFTVKSMFFINVSAELKYK